MTHPKLTKSILVQVLLLDGRGHLLGRLSAIVAKQLLLGTCSFKHGYKGFCWVCVRLNVDSLLLGICSFYTWLYLRDPVAYETNDLVTCFLIFICTCKVTCILLFRAQSGRGEM